MSRTFECPGCGWHGHPSFDLTKSGKLAAKCGGKDCDYTDPTLGPADFNEGLAVTRDGRTMVQPAPRPLPAADAPKPRHAPPPVAPVDVIGQIRARRDYLASEIARLEGLRVEHRKLTKMLAAADKIEPGTTNGAGAHLPEN